MGSSLAYEESAATRKANRIFREKLAKHPICHRRDVIVHTAPDNKGHQLATVLMAVVERRQLMLSANSTYQDIKAMVSIVDGTDYEVFLHEDDREQGLIVAERCAMLAKATAEMEEAHGTET